MPYYQLVGYNWNHWINREVSRVTKAEINHVTIRVVPFYGESHELYVSHRETDTYVPSKLVERINGAPIWKGQEHQIKLFDGLEMIKNKAAWWQQTRPGNIWYPYFYHYVGRHLGLSAPWTCTRLCCEILQYFGHNVQESFYPNRLVQEYIKEVY